MDNVKHDSYKVILEGGSGEFEDRKSRFIANIIPVSGEDQALAHIEAMKKKYWDARHNCSAYIIGNGVGEIARCSDDGEPGGTAGRPMLEVLQGENIKNVCVVVTRYFGGTLLGTGGLVRAYSQAVKEGLANSRIGVMEYGTELKIVTDYNGIGKILYILGQRGIEQSDSEYGVDVSLTVRVRFDEAASLEKEITDVTGGKAVTSKVKDSYFVFSLH